MPDKSEISNLAIRRKINPPIRRYSFLLARRVGNSLTLTKKRTSAGRLLEWHEYFRNFTPPDEMEANAAATPGARFHKIAGAGHLSPLESPDEVNAAILEFLS